MEVKGLYYCGKFKHWLHGWCGRSRTYCEDDVFMCNSCIKKNLRLLKENKKK